MKSNAHWFVLFWKRNRFTIFVVGSLLVLALCYKFDDDSPGTFSTNYFYDPDIHSTPRKAVKRAYPQESAGEKECRRVLEAMFGRPFPKERPPFLKNEVTGKPLEIDCCNLELGLGVEYNGRQHYEFTPGMHRTKDAFHTQKYRDLMKQRLCDEHGFTLVVVPHTVPVEDIQGFLQSRLARDRAYA